MNSYISLIELYSHFLGKMYNGGLSKKLLNEESLSWLKNILYTNKNKNKTYDKSWRSGCITRNSDPATSPLCLSDRCYTCQSCCGIHVQLIHNLIGCTNDNNAHIKNVMFVSCRPVKSFKWYIHRFIWVAIKHKKIDYSII